MTASRRSASFLHAVLFVLALALRYRLLTSKYQQNIAHHIEVSTPLNEWRRVREGLFLASQNIDPYDGDLLHEAPLSMYLYSLLEWLPLELVFVAVDGATAVLLYLTGHRYLYVMFVRQETKKHEYAPGTEDILLSGQALLQPPLYMAAAFLFNPYVIFSCVAMATTVFHNLFLALFLCAMVHGNLALSVVALGLCSMMSLYPIVLVIPLALYFVQVKGAGVKGVAVAPLFALTLLGLYYINSRLSEGRFMKNVYGFILTVPDLKPNIGLFWYFFTEMFDHFRQLFIFSFQINATILYLLPLSIKFRKDPFLLSIALLSLIAVFKSYPSLGDVGFVLSLLPCFLHLSKYTQQGFLVSVIFLITSALGPIVWHLWIYSNSANANFYFGVTLAFAIAQIFLITDILFAYLKREFCLEHGKERKIDGNEAVLVLE